MNSEVITSSSNQKIKDVASLLKKSDKRKKKRAYVVEGIKMVLDAPIEDIQSVYVSEELYTNRKVSDFIEECDSNNVDVNVVSDNIIKHISDTVTPQGIAAVIGCKKDASLENKSTYLLLEDIQDPGNMGTLFRTAEAAGIDVVIMSRGCVDIYNPKTIRSTMGTIYRIPFVRCIDTKQWQDIINELKSQGVKLYGGCLEDSSYYGDADYSSRCGVVIGNEGNGITESTLNMIDKVHIPMEGKIESLNASVAGSILMYEINRCRHMSDN